MFTLEAEKIIKSVILYVAIIVILYGVWIASTPLVAGAWAGLIILLVMAIFILGYRWMNILTKPKKRNKGGRK